MANLNDNTLFLKAKMETLDTLAMKNWETITAEEMAMVGFTGVEDFGDLILFFYHGCYWLAYDQKKEIFFTDVFNGYIESKSMIEVFDFLFLEAIWHNTHRDKAKQIQEACPHEERTMISAGGDAESGPRTVTLCKQCGKVITQYGM